VILPAVLAVGVGVLVGVLVGVDDRSTVGVFVSVLVAVLDGALPATTITNCGAFVPLRLEKLVAVLLTVDITKLISPAPVTNDVTSACVHVLAVIRPELPPCATSAGRY
jgi:hypothetical protein